MRILITGGAGRVGTPVSNRFVAKGWDVRVLGAEPTASIDGITYTQGDITDYNTVLEQMEGCDAVVHLAAIPSTRSHPSHVLFHINVTGTANVYEAAANAGVKRVVQASSINAIGAFWGCDDRQFDYFPLDENYSFYTTDPYSFSKQMVEDIAAYYWRRDGISGTSFRFPAVWTEDAIKTRNLYDNLSNKRQKLNEFLSLPQTEQDAILAEVKANVLDFRAKRLLEYDGIQSGLDKEMGQFDNWLWSTYLFDRYNYWAYVHTMDSTQAIEKAITAEYEGSHPLFINSDNNYLNYDSETLLRVFFPEATQRSKSIQGTDALINCDKAYQLIGFEPEFRFTFD